MMDFYLTKLYYVKYLNNFLQKITVKDYCSTTTFLIWICVWSVSLVRKCSIEHMFGIIGRKFDQISYVSELIGAFFELLGDWMKKNTLCLGVVL
jgi:hypothetical protein